MIRTLLPIVLALAPAVCEAQGVTSPYLQIVWRYRAGDVRGAVAAAAALPVAGLRERALRDLGSFVCSSLGETPDCDRLRERQPALYRERVVPIQRVALPAATLLHLHVSMTLDVVGKKDEAVAHRRLMRILIDRMAPIEADLDPPEAARFRDVRRRAHLLFAWLLQSEIAVDAADEDIRDALRAFPDDPDLLLASGWVEETRAQPAFLIQRYDARRAQTSTVGGPQSWMTNERAFRLSRASEIYRRCLALKPTLAEARVRLGRVQYLQNRPNEARATLAELGAAEPRIRYLAALFSAAIEERAGTAGAARRRYDDAMRAWPESQVARVALGRLLARDGDRAGAAALVAELSADSDTLDASSDPWSFYPLGQAWRLERSFVELRADLHR